ncbi:hypothetical protein HLH34_02555 [Gluconacetobacter azotocaptans]|uniref:Uncharacterized protein n=1 Tax=Gluconacetobacter azotocaptans TaxID=142834 RepID=A0A7W4JQ51_9PROT|nr:hypothetical protein [Gluconacetobacter azotocaptans]MBB2188846.1 hypothetical protein [Gluconacetobacter azotocaptans]MBM9401613.1 hypothetical protein [Gluconacetobacter azotocaptans]
MSHAAGIIGHILVSEWMATRGERTRVPPGAQRRLRGAWPMRRTGLRAPAWPGYVASVRHVSAGLSRRVAFRRQR